MTHLHQGQSCISSVLILTLTVTGFAQFLLGNKVLPVSNVAGVQETAQIHHSVSFGWCSPVGNQAHKMCFMSYDMSQMCNLLLSLDESAQRCTGN